MLRPYIICHMTTSIDGKVTGEFLKQKVCEKAIDVYYEINRQLKCDGFICGRVTMEESFTGGYYPDLNKYALVVHDCDIKNDCVLDESTGYYAIAIDPKGRLGWKSNVIKDDDIGYDNAQVLEVLTEQVDERYLSYLQAMKIPYIFAGETEIDIELLLYKLRTVLGIKNLLLEGGSIVNGSFLRAGVVDELSIVVAPLIGGNNDKPLFDSSIVSSYELSEVTHRDDVVVMNYLKKNNRADNDIIKIEWHDAKSIDDAILSDAADGKGLYYITRVFGHKETSLYLGIATKKNTIRHRLNGHQYWVHDYRGLIKVRIGKIVYPHSDIDEIIDHAESAILFNNRKVFIENTAKVNSYTYNRLFRIFNIGDIFEIEPYIDMNEHT